MTVTPPRAGRTAVIAANSAWNILNFRRPVVEALLANGCRVVAVAPADGCEAALRELGAEFVPIELQPGGTSVWADAHLFRQYQRILQTARPEVFLGFTVKPNIYGSLAARLLGIKVVNNISGLGTAVIGGGLLNMLVSRLYRMALRRSATVFFQNRHDLELFVDRRLVRRSQARLIPGSGIDLARFTPRTEAGAPDAPFRFLFVGRLLRDKGVVEYAEAARSLRPRWPGVEFAMMGSASSDNPTAVPIDEVERWQREGIVRWYGEQENVRPFLGQADCVVLPSYREGLSRSLLEAAAMGKPMIATDVPGCSDVVEHGENGFLCEPRSAASLAAAMEAMLHLPPDERAAMGHMARQKVEREFDQALVVQAYLDAVQ